MQMRGILLILVVSAFWLGAGLALEAPPTPPPPTLSDNFHDPEIFLTQQGLGSMNYSVWQYLDPSSQVMSLKGSGIQNGFPIEVFEVFGAEEYYEELNGICRNYNQSGMSLPWSSLFMGATFGGYVNITQTVFNRTVSCQMWTLAYQYGVAYIADNNMPIRLVLPDIQTTVDFSPFYESNPPGLTPSSSVFQPPESCFTLYNCSGEGEATQLEVYNYHDAGDFFLNNTNTADAVGDAFFVCGTLVYGNPASYQWISQWQVEVNSSYGQYALCNWGICLGGDTHRVGREGSFGYGQDYGGECTTNDNLGSWFSFPDASQCQGDQEIGDDGCTWKILTRVKTINASCLLNSTHFAQACEEYAPVGKFDELGQLFSQAFSSDDPSQGGCPAIDVGEEIATLRSANSVQLKSPATKTPSPFSSSFQNVPSFSTVLRHLSAIIG